jgi:repressor LexA
VHRFMQLLKSHDLMDVGPDDQLIPGKRFFDIPYTDHTVQAGEFTESFGQGGGYRSLQDIMIRKPSITRMMQVRGDSMSDIGIYDGDWAVYEKRPGAMVKDIVIALLEGANSYTIKELGKEGNDYILIPHNKAFEIIRPKTNFHIEGILIDTVRTYKARYALAS